MSLGHYLARTGVVARAAASVLAGAVMPALLHAQPSKPARLQGTVYDSTRALSFAGAEVVVMDTKAPASLWRTTTDARGGFRFDSLPGGTFVVVATHPRLDSLGVQQLSRGIELQPGGTERLRLFVPSMRTLIRRICGDTLEAERSGYVRGVLRNAERPLLSAPGVVQLRWLELSIGKRGVSRTVVSLQARTNDEGRFTACGVPAEGILQVEAWSGGDSTGVLELTVPSDGVLLRDLHVGKSRSVTVPIRESVIDPLATISARDSTGDTTVYEARLRRGATSLRVLAQRVDGAPIPDARVTVWGTGVEQRTPASGRAVLNDLPTGSYTVDVRALGYAPLRATVELFPGDTGTVRLSLDKLVLLDPVKVAAMRISPSERRLQQFEENRRMRGFGRFITPEMIEKSQPIRVADLFRMIPGTRIVPGPWGDRIVMRSVSMRGWCTPELWVDGMRVVNDLTLDILVSVQDLLAAEVYTGGAAVPAQYSGLSGCGAIVLYTGDRDTIKR